MQSFGILFGLFFFGNLASASKILVYSPQIGSSHVNFMGKLADLLVENGHDVVALIAAYDREVTTNGTKLARIIRWDGYDYTTSMSNITKHFWKESGIIATYKMFRDSINASVGSCDAQLGDRQLIETLRSEKFDLAICEVIFQCGFVLFKKVGINNYVTALAVNPFEWITEGFGVESNPSYVPGMHSKAIDVMNYSERLSNALTMLFNNFMFKVALAPFIKMIQTHFSEPIDHVELMTNSSFLFTNAEELLDFPRLTSHKVVYVGGIAVEKPKPLEPKYQDLMDSATNGAVLISFGSIAQSAAMDEDMRNIFLQTFQQFPKVKFIWKFEDENHTVSESNIFFSDWLPQNDLLGHTNMLAFISHCGLNSLTETVYASVPVICIPLFGDQLRNSKIAEKRRIGISLDKAELSVATLTEALNAILHNEKYRSHSTRLAQMIRDKPFSPRDQFLRHVNFALKFGPVHNFNVAGVKLGYIRYYLLDVIALVVAILSILGYLLTRFMIFLMRFIKRLLFTRKTKTE